MKARVLLLLVVLCFALPSAASAASTTIVFKKPGVSVSDASVNLYCRLKAGKKIYSISGSGAFVDPRGVILTNAHVAQYFLLPAEKGRVTGWCSVRTGSPAEEAYTAEVLYIAPSWLKDKALPILGGNATGTGEGDFALLYITGAEEGALPASFPSLTLGTTTPEAGASVSITGYPAEKLNFSDVRNRLEVITAPSTVTNTQSFDRQRLPDVLTLAASGASAGGISGGPVTSQGTVAGIITSKSADKKAPVLRAITVPYMDRAIRAQAGVPLSSVVTGDLAARAAVTRLLFPENIVHEMAKTLRARK